MNPEPRALTAQQLIRALEADGFRWVRSTGSHRVYRHAVGRRAVVALHRPEATFPPETLTAMLRGTGWTDTGRFGPTILARSPQLPNDFQIRGCMIDLGDSLR